ncbi:phosphonoacetaldehyde hydrolase [Roseospira navarrensis]|uniref:Phosphonoacetaldehyde hydrolase n=1 Tax=Roseospira navarrensis TaxID=140058 RepID=A0A7X2D327_9PROT|nr:phosphonoacetaldehyde hydrolase [Roseospira navarrensis]MQX36351.1 phosphonoacetaldehyde hydrolase [Roseospira navarrensis]
MTHRYTRAYTGPLRAVVFDWAGTLIDFGCRAPAAVFRTIFTEAGAPVSESEARAPMGLPKRDHIAAVGRTPRVAAAWREAHGRDFSEDDVDALYEVFLPRQIDVVGQYAEVIPGVVEALAAARARGLAIGSTTGYTRDIMEICLARAAEQGLTVDALACAGDLPRGRPGPYLLWRVLTDLAVYPPEAVVKVGDTPADVEEGLNAGTWVVAVAACGNETGLSATELAALPDAERTARVDRARGVLARTGAHVVIETTADLPAVLDDLSARLARGERP